MFLTEVELTRFFFVIVLLLIFSLFWGYVFQRCGLPKVVGEIFGGFLLGPTILGFFLPAAYAYLFQAFPSEGKLLSFLSWFGLILLMFTSGFEVQKSVASQDKKIILAILLGSTVLPFILGWTMTNIIDIVPYVGEKGNILALKIIIAIAVAVTSIPVISRIFIDLNIMQTRFAKIVLITASLHDLILWMALAIATGLVSTTAMSFHKILMTIGVTLLFFVFMLFFMPLLIRWVDETRFNFLRRSSSLGYTLFICFLSAAVASALNINIVFGALMAGVVVGLMPAERFAEAKENIKNFAVAFFTPIYFAIVGLKLDLIYHFDFKFFMGFFLFSSLVQIAGTYAAAKVVHLDNKSSFNFAVAMTTRGGPGIVLATVAFELGIISESLYVSLVLVAIVTSLLSGYWFRRVVSSGKELLN